MARRESEALLWLKSYVLYHSISTTYPTSESEKQKITGIVVYVGEPERNAESP